MSADTTVIIAAYCFHGSELSYTADVVQAADSLYGENPAWVLKWAKANFLGRRLPWFTGKGGLSRAKQFANLLAEEYREKGWLEYHNRPMIEIGTDRVYLLSPKGKRTSNGRTPIGWIGPEEEYYRALCAQYQPG